VKYTIDDLWPKLEGQQRIVRAARAYVAARGRAPRSAEVDAELELVAAVEANVHGRERAE
jgi:hypothetical protein